MRKVLSITTVALILVSFTTVDVAAQGVSIQVPFSQLVNVPCAAGGAGEDVLFQGTLHIVNYVTFDTNGGVHLKIQFQPQGTTGTGLTTGDIYRGTGATQQIINASGNGLPIENTFVNSFKVIGPGPDNNIIITQSIHFTIDANGNLTADVDHTSVECR